MAAGARRGDGDGWSALRRAVLAALAPSSPGAPSCPPAPVARWSPGAARRELPRRGRRPVRHVRRPRPGRLLRDDAGERARLIALVELARGGDREAFGELYDHYHPSVYRFLYYRTRSQSLAEDLAADTFFRALRNMDGLPVAGRDFGGG